MTLAAGAVHLRCDACLRPCGEGARSVVTRLLLSVIRVPRTLLLDAVVFGGGSEIVSWSHVV